MNILRNLKSQLRNRRQSDSQSAWSRYRELIRCVHEDQNIDIDSAQSTLDSVGKSWSQLEDEDLPQYRKRLDLQRQVADGQNAEKRLRAEQAKLEALRQELLQARNRLEPAISSVAQSVRELEHTVGSGQTAFDMLSRSCMDESLTQKMQSIEAEISDRLRERSDISEKLTYSRVGGLQSSIGQAEDQLKFWTQKSADSYNRDPYDLRQRDYWQTARDNLLSRQEALQGSLRALDADILRLRSEQDGIRSKMMEP